MFYLIGSGRVHQTYQLAHMLLVWNFGKKNVLQILYLVSLNLWSWQKWVVCHMRSNLSNFCLAVHLCWRQWVSFLLCMIWNVNWKCWLNWWSFEELLLKQKFISSGEIKTLDDVVKCIISPFLSFPLLLYFLQLAYNHVHNLLRYMKLVHFYHNLLRYMLSNGFFWPFYHFHCYIYFPAISIQSCTWPFKINETCAFSSKSIFICMDTSQWSHVYVRNRCTCHHSLLLFCFVW